MKVLTILIISLVVVKMSAGQELLPNGAKVDSIYNFFTEEYDTIIYDIGRVVVMPYTTPIEQYSIKRTNSVSGTYAIFIQNRLLFQYNMEGNEINGTGYCYYPIEGTVAVQAQFENNKLHGLVVVQNADGVILEIMKFKNGVYRKHVYDFQVNDKKGLRVNSKHRSSNPLRNDELIITYTRR